jgi:hypothetical protein
MISIRTERADVARGIVYEAMPDHLVFAFEPFTTLTASTAWHGTIMRSSGRMHIRV